MRKILSLICCLAAIAIASTHAWAEYEAVSHAVNTYDGQCGGHNDDLEMPDDIQDAWSLALSSPFPGCAYSQVAESFDEEVRRKYWTDDSLFWYGADDDDPDGTDFADVALFLGHGFHYFNQQGCRLIGQKVYLLWI